MSGIMLAAFQLGFVYSLVPGPILIASSQRVVSGGWRQGCWFILGVTLADLIYIAVVHWGFSKLFTSNHLISIGLWILGGTWLMKLGIDALRASSQKQSLSKSMAAPRDSRRTVADGLLINLLNPLTIVGWIALAANFLMLSNSNASPGDAENLTVFFVVLLGILSWQLLVVGFFSIVRKQFHSRLFKSLSLIGGIGLVVYGLGSWLSAISLLSNLM